MLGAELAAADDAAADADAELPAVPVSEAVLGARLAAADDAAADDADADAAADAELPAAAVSAAVFDGLFPADATATMTSTPNAMNPVSTLCRAGQDLRFCPFGAWGGMAGCGCHGSSCRVCRGGWP